MVSGAWKRPLPERKITGLVGDEDGLAALDAHPDRLVPVVDAEGDLLLGEPVIVGAVALGIQDQDESGNRLVPSPVALPVELGKVLVSSNWLNTPSA